MNIIHIHIQSRGPVIQSYSFMPYGNSFEFNSSSHELFMNNAFFFKKKGCYLDLFSTEILIEKWYAFVLRLH